MKNNRYLTVMSDMFWMQLIWALSFLGVMSLIYIVRLVASFFLDNDVNSFFDFTMVPANIFMLIIGITAGMGFLNHYVSHGITRKDYFKGGTIALIGISMVLPILTALITYVFGLIVKILPLSIIFEDVQNVPLETDGNVLSNIIESVFVSPFVDLQSQPLLALLIFTLHALTYYVVGWLIGSAFYRFGAVVGIGSIALGVTVLFVEDLLIYSSLGEIVFEFIGDLPLYLSVFILLLVLGAVLWLIRQFTKKVAIKM